MARIQFQHRVIRGLSLLLVLALRYSEDFSLGSIVFLPLQKLVMFIPHSYDVAFVTCLQHCIFVLFLHSSSRNGLITARKRKML